MAYDIPRYIARIYDGSMFVGCGNFNTIEDCKNFAINDPFADKLRILDLEGNGKWQTIKLQPKEYNP